jgi:ATP-dependent exoDNAse (exonuclease V) beta subunit
MSQFLIYKSSAGSGKTTALISIFLKLALSSPRPDAFKRILAITFTNKASNEMKERLIKELDKLSNLPEGYTGGDFMIDQVLDSTGITPAELKKRAWNSFQLLLHDYGDVGISTIDTFNQRLIRSFSRELNLRADFEVELEEKALFHDTVIRLVERIGQDEHLTRHLVGFVSHMLDEDKKVNIIRKLEELQDLILNEDALEAVKSLGEIDKEAFAELKKNLKAETTPYPEKVRSFGRAALEWMDASGITTKHLKQGSRSWPSYFNKMVKFDGNESIGLTDTQQNLLGNDWIHPSLKAANRAAVEALMPELEKKVAEAITINTKEFESYFFAKTILNQLDLIAVIGDLSQTLETIREERNILPISYFNRIVSEALREEPVAFLYENFGNRYDHILIDEFQDTSTLQWLNLLPLVEETLSRGKTSLVVGDAKQSIYRWRGGRAEQLIALPDLNVNDPVLQDSIRRNAQIEMLSTNYRSLPNIIDFNNIVSSSLGLELTSEGSLFRREYESANVTQLIPDKKSGGYVEVQYLGKNAKKDAHWAELLRQISSSKNSGVAYGDMAILIRNAKEGREIVAHLKRNGITVVTSDSFEIDQHNEVKLILSLLRIGIEPGLVPPKLSAMRCLADIHGWPYEPHKYAAHKNIDFNAFLKEHGLPTLSEKYFDTGAYQVCETLATVYLSGSRQNPGITALLNTIVKFGGMAANTIEFLSWWDALKTKPSASENPSPESIQLLTIHKAKGLQFRVCFMPYIDWQMHHANDVQWTALGNRSLGPLKYVPLSNSAMEKSGFKTEAEAAKTADRFDNLNLIYVALTRAVEQLFICFTSSGVTRVGAPFLSACSTASAQLQSAENFLFSAVNEEGQPTNSIPKPEEPFVLRTGTIQATKPAAHPSSSSHMLTEPSLSDRMWYDRFEMAYDRNQYGSNISRKTGILFHQVVANALTLSGAQDAIRILAEEGHVEQTGANELNAMVKTLYESEEYNRLAAGASRLAERELLFDGKIIRPDLVLMHEDKAIVVDYKTGSESEEENVAQVAQYMRAVADATGKPTDGFLVYLSPIKWVEVKHPHAIPTQRSLFD